MHAMDFLGILSFFQKFSHMEFYSFEVIFLSLDPLASEHGTHVLIFFSFCFLSVSSAIKCHNAGNLVLAERRHINPKKLVTKKFVTEKNVGLLWLPRYRVSYRFAPVAENLR